MYKRQGWGSYTLSKAEKRIPGDNLSPAINDGNFYPSNFDRRHDFSLTAIYLLGNRWSISSNFVYYTGRPYSFPGSKYEIDGIIVPHYGERNMQRLDNYHRMDISATLSGKNQVNKRYESSWVFSLYNVYSRKNVKAYFFTFNEEDSSLSEIQRLTILGTIIPSVTYNFKF